jgi:hypothetical protein
MPYGIPDDELVMQQQEARESEFELKAIAFAKKNVTRILSAVQEDNMIGFCVTCGEEAADNCEPDMRACSADHLCDCPDPCVYGAAELLFYIKLNQIRSKKTPNPFDFPPFRGYTISGRKL